MTLERFLQHSVFTAVFAVAASGCNCGGSMMADDAGATTDSGGGEFVADASVTADAGSGIDAGTDGGISSDAGVGDAGAGDAGLNDAGFVSDAGVDAGVSIDSGIDAGPLNALYGNIAGKLVRFNLPDGGITEIADSGQPYLVAAWDDSAQVLRVISDVYTPLGGTPPTPKLGTLDLCTGVITVGPHLAIGANNVRRAEGLARDPDAGTFYVTVGINGTTTPTEFISESNGTVDISTGAVTVHGNHQTLQDDGDTLMFVGPSLYLLDVSTANNQGALYSINTSTGAVIASINTGPKVLRVANDPTRNVVFATYGEGTGTNRGIGTLNLSTGTLTKLGADLPNTLYPNSQFTMLVSVPEPVCP